MDPDRVQEQEPSIRALEFGSQWGWQFEDGTRRYYGVGEINYTDDTETNARASQVFFGYKLRWEGGVVFLVILAFLLRF